VDSPGETLLNSDYLKIQQSGNAHADRHQFAAVFAIRYVGVRPTCSLPSTVVFLSIWKVIVFADES